MTLHSMAKIASGLPVALFALGAGPAVAKAADDSAVEQKVEHKEEKTRIEEHVEAVKLQRRGAGLRVGVWDVQGLAKVDGAEYSQSPAFEAYFQKGLDTHLVIESGLGLWRRTQHVQESGSFGSSSSEQIKSYILPAFSAIKVYPLTRPETPLEPYVDAGIGFVLGIDDREVSNGGLLGAGTDAGTKFGTGYGFKAGSGLEWKFSRAFGLNAGASYQWIQFTQDLGGARTFKGLRFNGGLTYRFQY